MRIARILLLFVVACAAAAAFASTASALGYEDEPCPLNDPVDHQLKVCHPNAEVGKSYSLQIRGKGGCTPDFVRYDVVNGTLPPGLSVSQSTALVSGTPTQPGVYKFWLQISDLRQSWCVDDKQSQWQFQITVVQGLQIQQRQSNLTPAQTGTAYNLQLSATGGSTLTWSIASGALPAGLTLNASTGLISGTPTATGDTHFQVKVTDGTRTDVQTYNLSVVDPLKLTGGGTARAEVGMPYKLALHATGGRPGYVWALASDSKLPEGLALDSASGAIVGTPGDAGTFNLKVSVTDSLGLAQSVNVTLVVAPPLAIAKNPLPTAKAGLKYRARLRTDGGVTPLRWHAIRMPAGLHLNTRTGVISGKAPSRATTYRVIVQVKDALGAQSRTTFVLKVVSGGARRHR